MSEQEDTEGTSSPASYAVSYVLPNTTSVAAGAWSPDGIKLAITDVDGNICVWNTDTGAFVYAVARQKLARSVTWAPHGKCFVTSNLDGTLGLWMSDTGRLRYTLSGHRDVAWSVVWSPDGQYLASGSLDHSVCVWDVRTQTLLHTLIQHTEPVITVAWSPDGQHLASGSLDHTVCVWDVQEGKLLSLISDIITSPIRSLLWYMNVLMVCQDSTMFMLLQLNEGKLSNHAMLPTSEKVGKFCWSLDRRFLAIDFSDHTIRLYDQLTDNWIVTLEGHTDTVSSLAFSNDGQLLASFAFSDAQQSKGTMRIWRTVAGKWVLEPVLQNVPTAELIIFHPELKAFATIDSSSHNIVIWRRNELVEDDSLLVETIYYRNAKVVLVGDSGVGKSGLGLVLMDKPFEPTESTHGRHIWTLCEQKLPGDSSSCAEMRETLLWDLAGQPGYRLIHQLHLDEVTLALVVFDGKSETDAFAGVLHWERALRQAQSLQRQAGMTLKKFLVAARVDRGGIAVSPRRIEDLMQKFKFEHYFETSAKSGRHIKELKAAIETTIIWEELPVVSSTRLFYAIRSFLLAEKEAGRTLERIDTLYQLFLTWRYAPAQKDDLRTQFERGIGRLESVGLIKRLNFSNLLLLQPELLDAYASALINAVRDEPEGFGSMEEEKVENGDFYIPEDQRLQDKTLEPTLLIAMVRDLLYRELILREGNMLIFPAQSTREYSELSESVKESVVFRFDGPVLNIYVTLAVRLANSGFFKRDELWRNAVTYNNSISGKCGVLLRKNVDGHGELSLFFDDVTNEQTCFLFEEYVEHHLLRHALSGSLKRNRIFICSECDTVVTEQTVQKRKQRGFDWLNCPVCEKKVSLLDQKERVISSVASLTQVMDYSADREREREANKSILDGKRANNEFDVFLCYHRDDKVAIRQYGRRLKERGILPWFDEWEVQPGLSRQQVLQEQITKITSVAVFIGQAGVKSWALLEQEAFLQQFVERNCPVIPVFLPEAGEIASLSPFLRGMEPVDFRKQDPDPFLRLVWGITGKRPELD